MTSDDAQQAPLEVKFLAMTEVDQDALAGGYEVGISEEIRDLAHGSNEGQEENSFARARVDAIALQ